jgi:hypothetical protein
MTPTRPLSSSISLPAVSLFVACLCAAAPAGADPAAGEDGHGVAVAQAQTPASRTPAPADAYCYIGWPNDGEIIKTTRIKIWFGTRNFGVAPAGVNRPNTGHHHLLIDSPLPDLGEAIPNDRNHLHFGMGQTEAVIELPPGTHTLQLLMGDADHVPHEPPVMSKKITIHVRGGAGVAEAR